MSLSAIFCFVTFVASLPLGSANKRSCWCAMMIGHAHFPLSGRVYRGFLLGCKRPPSWCSSHCQAELKNDLKSTVHLDLSGKVEACKKLQSKGAMPSTRTDFEVSYFKKTSNCRDEVWTPVGSTTCGISMCSNTLKISHQDKTLTLDLGGSRITGFLDTCPKLLQACSTQANRVLRSGNDIQVENKSRDKREGVCQMMNRLKQFQRTGRYTLTVSIETTMSWCTTPITNIIGNICCQVANLEDLGLPQQSWPNGNRMAIRLCG